VGPINADKVPALVWMGLLELPILPEEENKEMALTDEMEPED